MFHVDRWAEAFLNIHNNNADAEYERLKALIQVLKTVPRYSFRKSAAHRLEKLLKESAGPELEYARKFILLIISKNCYNHIDSILAAIEKKLDEHNGILNVTMETAAAPDNVFEDEFRKMICSRTGAAGIKMKIKTIPGLIAGYRLRIGGFCIDASLRRQLEKMTEILSDGGQAAAGVAH